MLRTTSRRLLATTSFAQQQRADLNPVGKYFNEKIAAYKEDQAKPRVAVLKLDGQISSQSGKKMINVTNVVKRVQKLNKIKNLKHLCLVINSPGGSPAQSELVAKYLKQVAQEKKIPITVFVEDVAASGGYWLACVGEKIYVSRTSIIGSIGVISGGFGFVDAIEKLGVERRVYTSGTSKSQLDPFKPEKPEDLEKRQRILNDLHEVFIEHVKSHRSEHFAKAGATDEELFNGDVYLGDESIKKGLADEVGDVYSWAAEKYGSLGKVKLVEVKGLNPFEEAFSVASSAFAASLVDAADNKVRAESQRFY